MIAKRAIITISKGLPVSVEICRLLGCGLDPYAVSRQMKKPLSRRFDHGTSLESDKDVSRIDELVAGGCESLVRGHDIGARFAVEVLSKFHRDLDGAGVSSWRHEVIEMGLDDHTNE